MLSSFTQFVRLRVVDIVPVDVMGLTFFRVNINIANKFEYIFSGHKIRKNIQRN